MKKAFFTLAAIILFVGICFASYTGYPEKDETKAVENPKTWCPRTLISDNNRCMDCHVIPDFKLKEAKPGRGLTLPFHTKLVDGKLRFYLEDIISNNVQDFFDYLSWHPEYKEVIIEINSPGGSLWHAWKIVSLIQQAQRRGIQVTTICHGMAASAGFIVFAAGDIGHRFVGPLTETLHHELWTVTWLKVETPSSKEEEAKTLRHFQDSIHNWLVTRCTKKITKEELDDMVRHKDYWMNGQDCIDAGFADGYIE